MSFSWRYVTLAAVSDEQQATEDKDSIPHQLKVTREYGERMGGEFVREYVAAGYSRSGYYDLTTAFTNIPAFGQLARDARLHKFDVILLESMDRLGDIGYMLFNFLATLGSPYIQIRAVQQALPIEDPTIYHPRKDDSTPMMLNQSLTINRYRTSKIVRAFAVGNPRRARDGKYAMRVPDGYRRTQEKEAVIDERLAPLIAKFPEWFLSGVTRNEIAQRANQADPRGKVWNITHVTRILENPFFAGKTFHDRKNTPDLYDGKHEPLWSWDTYLKIQAELKRIRSRPRAKKSDYNFTSILKCSECGEILHIAYDSNKPQYKFWTCPKRHCSISVRRANKAVANELRRLYDGLERVPPPKEEVKDYTKKQLNQVNFEMQRLEDAYFAGAYTAVDYAEKKKALEARRADLLNEQLQADEAKRRIAGQEQAFMTLQAIMDKIEWWIENDDPVAVKYLIDKLVTLTVYPDKRIVAERRL